MSDWLRQTKLRPRHVPFVILGLCLLAYGLYIPWMGFYWDDWPWMWFASQSDGELLLRLEGHRPLSNLFLWLSAKVLGTQPLGWQAFTVGIRWLSGVSLWWALRKIWPERDSLAAWAACLFVVYPGFGQQFVSVNSSRHILGLALFLLSAGLMVSAAREGKHYWRRTGAALGLSLAGMLLTEYYYGLELLRPLVLWFAAEEGDRRTRLRQSLTNWGPFLLVTLGVFAWRFLLSREVNYGIRVFDEVGAAPQVALLGYAVRILQDAVEASWVAWSRTIRIIGSAELGPRSLLVYGAVIVLSGLGTYFFLRGITQKEDGGRQAAALGLAGLLLGGLPFLVTGLPVKIAFPADRATLPLSFGATLLLVGLIYDLGRWRALQQGLLAVLIALAVGWHFQNAASYRRDWTAQVDFLQQLSWRAPGLKPGTLLLSEELPILYSTDDSLTAALNWHHAPDYAGEDSMHVGMLYLALRTGTKLPAIEPGTRVGYGYRFFQFEGNTEEALVVYYAPPACLRVLDPQFDQHFPRLPELTSNALMLSNSGQIIAHLEGQDVLSQFFDQKRIESSWCYYFQRADLARQVGDWETIAALGETAFALQDSPNHASERLPFIEAYAHVGNWELAKALTAEAMEINRFMGPMLCEAWARIENQVDGEAEQEDAVKEMFEVLDCSSGT